MRNLATRTAVGLVPFLLASMAVAAEEGGSPLDKAMKQAGRDGRPILAIAGRDACPLCGAFRSRLNTDRSLRPMLASYSTVFVNIDSPQSGYQELVRRKNMGGKLPFVYVLRADGELISANVDGTKVPLEKLLHEGAAKSGRVLSPTEAVRAEAAVAKAKTAMEREDVSQAVTLLGPLGKAESFAAPLVEAKKMLSEIGQQATQEVEECERALGEEDKLAGAVLLSEANRKYLKLAEQKKPLLTLTGKLRKEEGGRELLAQADEIVRARGLSRLGRNDRAAQAYDQIIKKYPDTPVAKLAAEERDALGQEDAAKKPAAAGA